jgi:hypothetical protein
MKEKQDASNQPYFAPAVSDEAPVLASAQDQEDMRQIESHDAGGIFGAGIFGAGIFDGGIFDGGIFDGGLSGILKKLAELEARVKALEEPHQPFGREGEREGL